MGAVHDEAFILRTIRDEPPPRRPLEVHGAGKAWVERMDRADNLERLLRIVNGGPDEARFLGGALPFPSRGEAFQVLGTTSR